MDSTSREIRRLNIKSFLIDLVFGAVTVAAEAAICYLGNERLPALSTICMFGCLACVWKHTEAGVEAPLLVILHENIHATRE